MPYFKWLYLVFLLTVVSNFFFSGTHLCIVYDLIVLVFYLGKKTEE